MNKPTNKLIPDLRFPEFMNEGEWEEKSIGDISISESSSMALNKLDLKSSGYPVYGADSIVGYIDEFQQKEKYISIVKDGSGVGRLNLCENQSSILGTLACLKSKNQKNYDITWIYYLLNTVDFSSYVKGSGIPHIYFSDFKNDNIAVPKPQEQQKIASCLSSLDEVIAAHSQKLELLKTHKKGLMQNLFPQMSGTGFSGLKDEQDDNKILSIHSSNQSCSDNIPKYRFPEFENDGEWVEKMLGDKEVSFFVNEKISVNKLNIDSYISTENMLPEFSGVLMASKLPLLGSFTKFRNGDILISNIRPYLKKVWKSDKIGGASNDVLVFRSGSEVLSEFLEFILKNEAFINYVMESAKGVKMPRGDKDSMQKYTVFIPSKAEQQKIASCLSSLDDLIMAQAEKIEQLKLHKKGLMQGLFPKIITD